MSMFETTKKLVKKVAGRQLTRIVALVLMCVICTSSLITVAALTKDVTVIDGGNSYALTTLNPADTDRIFQQLGITVAPEDLVELNDEEAVITIHRAFDVSIKADGKTKILKLNKGTVSDALALAGVTMAETDRVSPAASTTLAAGLEIEITRGRTVTVEADGQTVTVTVSANATVLEAIDAAKVKLGEDDTLSAERDQAVTDGMTIKVDRVAYHEITAIEEIPYETIEEETSDLDRGVTQVKTSGENGERTVVTRETVVNGEVTGTETISETVTKEPVQEVVLVGTRKVATAAAPSSPSYTSASTGGDVLYDHDGNAVSYVSVLTGSGTAYTANAGAYTASGMQAAYGRVAVNPNVIPYGTRLYICSPDGSFVYGYAVAADTGGALMSGSALVDLYFNTLGECYQFGRRTVSVYVLG